MKIYITTDNHFGHKEIVSYCGRPENYEELILKNIRKTVNEDDIIINLGDFAFKNKESWLSKYLEATGLCKNWLIRGNHDDKPASWFLQKGFDFCGDYIELEYKGIKIAFSHAPIDNPKILTFHGHWHNVTWRKDEFKGNYTNNVLLALEDENTYKLWDLDLLIKPYRNKQK